VPRLPLLLALTPLFLLAGCGGDGDAAPETPALVCPDDGGRTTDTCNGSAALCERPFDQVSFATTHNAMSNRDEGWVVPNQEHGITRQLADGVRGLMLDTHDIDGVPYLCHGVCELGKLPLVDGLARIRDFLACHPREIVTLIFESYVTPEATAAAFEDAGLLPYLYTHALGAPWPTLAELSAGGSQLVVFTDQGAGTPPWYMDQWAHAFQNPYHAESPAELSCDVDRGSGDNPLFVMNHFLTKPVATPELAAQVNEDPFFLGQAEKCRAERGKIPAFVTVDFYSIGDLFNVVRSLNGLGPP
jgi:hypothetical protein